MAFVSKTAVSRLIAENNDADQPSASQTRGDYKKLKELEEARKLGNAPAAVDEEGKDINPHIPQYISDAPWYLDPKGPTLKHQRQQEEKIKKFSSLKEWYHRGVDIKSISTKYRKGACENCGAMTHAKKDCLERPRKIGAKFTNSNFAPDEFVQPNLSMSFDGKRDRWNGYDNFQHQEVVEEFHKLEEVKRELKKERLMKAEDDNAEDDDGAPSSDEDEDKYVDKMDMPGTKVDAAERYTVRNLRIREDTAKYLRNLDPNSAYYDPKTRSMRKNPYEGTGLALDEVDYAGDNFVRISGDTVTHAQSQLFAWDAGRKGLDVHALAEPTKLELLKKEYATKKEDFKDDAKKQLLEKYGGQQYLEAPPKELIFAQTENYVEYTRQGKVIRGEERNSVKSRYEEDVFHGNHTSVWGSFWSHGQWGYKCCHSKLKQSYCTGAAGKQQEVEPISAVTAFEKENKADPENEAKDDDASSGSESDQGSGEDKEEVPKTETRKKKKKKDKKKRKRRKNKEKDFDEEVAEAMKRQEKEEREAESLKDDRKRGYNNVLGFEAKAPTEAEMEAFYKRRKRAEDPMNF